VRFVRVGPRKVRDIADLIRGLTVAEAQQQIAAVHRPSAAPLLTRALNSAFNNANDVRESGKFNESELLVGEIYIDSGPMLKRFSAAPMGRAVPIRKRTAHVTVKLYTQG
jgi:large subunit ribosomal protein L22